MTNLTDKDRHDIEDMIKKHKPDCAPYLLTFLFCMFLTGCFKGCGY